MKKNLDFPTTVFLKELILLRVSLHLLVNCWNYTVVRVYTDISTIILHLPYSYFYETGADEILKKPPQINKRRRILLRIHLAQQELIKYYLSFWIVSFIFPDIFYLWLFRRCCKKVYNILVVRVVFQVVMLATYPSNIAEIILNSRIRNFKSFLFVEQGQR